MQTSRQQEVSSKFVPALKKRFGCDAQRNPRVRQRKADK
jgi:hypothetical protein